MANPRSLPLCVLAGAFMLATASHAQSAAQNARITGPIDESQLVTLTGSVHPAANARNDRGPVSASMPMPDMTLVLSRSPEEQQAFDAYVESEYDSGSPNFHHWLTPVEIGERFGPSEADIATICGWLSGHGLTVTSVPLDRMTIRFSGTASQVQSTFHTSIHNLSVNGAAHYGNMSNPEIPAALAPVVVGIKMLHNFLPRPEHKLGSLVQFNKQAGKWQRAANSAAASVTSDGSKPSFAPPGAASKPALSPRPLFGENACIGTDCETNEFLEEDVTPYDFATIYNVLPLWTANTPINGTNETIAIAGTSLINVGKNGGANDVATYRSAFGLTAGLTPIEIDTGAGPAATICTSTSATAPCGISDLTENTLDVEVSGAVAPAAQIDLVVTGQNSAGTIDTLYDSAQYVVQNVTAKILSLSYGLCELGQGTTENVAYYDLWQSAAAEGISVFVSTGDSGSPSCDDGGDAAGNPYVAQYGLSVNGIASTPFNTAVGGTDFSWCQPYYNSSGDFEGCAISSTTQGTPAYWSTSNSSTTGESALNYVPEIPWNDTCENPIQARYIETLLSVSGADSEFDVSPSTPDQTCNVLYEGWSDLDEYFEDEYDFDPYIEVYVDTVGGGGGASNCVVNNDSASNENPTCTAGSTSTGAANGSIPLTDDGWPVPSWQSGVPGTSGLTTRAIPDVSFFAGNGALDSATLICLSNLGACTYSASITTTTEADDATAQEIGGTSVASPEMAGVMALIDQKAGGAQGLATKELYTLAAQQTYSECSAETVKNTSSGCYFQDIDNGPSGYSNAQTNSMPCALSADTLEGGDVEGGEYYTAAASPNCAALTSGDVIGTLVSTGTTPAFNSATGYDEATGLGSLNVANVVNAWVSDSGTNTATMSITTTPAAGSSGTITLGTGVSLVIAATVTGSDGTPTGSVTVAGGGYNSSGTLSASGAVSITVPAGSLAPGTDTLSVTYSGDSNYASTSQTLTVSVAAATPTVVIVAPQSGNVANSVTATVTVSGPLGSPTPTGTVTVSSGTYSSTATTLTSGSASITIPPDNLATGTDTLTANYSGDSNYTSGSGTTQITMSGTALLTPTVTVTPSPTSIDSSQSLSVAVAVSGGNGNPTPTGTVTLTAGSCSTSSGGACAAVSLVGGAASFTIPGFTLSAGTVSVTANYSGDANYKSGTGTGSVTVTASTYSLTGTTIASLTAGATTGDTSTITGNASTTDYSGTVTVNSCTLTASPSGAGNLPSCTASGTITYASGTATGSATATVITSADTAMLDNKPAGWLRAGGGAVLAFLVFLGIPARRRNWLAMFGLVVLLASLGGLSACGSSGSTVITTSNATSPGTYTFTVSGTGSDPASTTGSGTFTVTVLN